MQLDACIDHFDVMDCGAAFNYCRDELMMPYAAAGMLLRYKFWAPLNSAYCRVQFLRYNDEMLLKR